MNFKKNLELLKISYIERSLKNNFIINDNYYI